MIDLAYVKIIAGNGGDGAVSFFKLKNRRFGKPDGGDGGKGGSVFIESDEDVFDLEEYRGKSVLSAENGGNGGKNRKKGKDGEDVVLKVPVGTVVKVKIYSAQKNLLVFPPATELVVDLKEHNGEILVAKGGEGGRGNSHARWKRDKKGKQPNHWQAFSQAQKGKPGERAEVVLELKYLAGIGIIGLPNVGKSTLLSVLTNAQPKIADYPFTTLEPNIGVMPTENVSSIVLADIPGLIEGASKGKGLGFNFLRHIERTSILVHVVDVSGEPMTAYKIVRGELALYQKDLDKKKEILVLNKIELADKEKLKKITALFKKQKPILISCQTGEGLDKLRKTLISLAKKI